MNRWFATAFGTIITIFHIFFIVGILAFLFVTVKSQADMPRGMMTWQPFAVVAISIVTYIVIMGALTTFISMNERLERLEELQAETNKLLRHGFEHNTPPHSFFEPHSQGEPDEYSEFGPADR
jgi:heme/copper-type cytochrome/quinol oxidase subunit 2